MARSVRKSSVDKSAQRTLKDKAILDAMRVREAVFDLGDQDLVLLAEALLCGIAQAGREAPFARAGEAAHIAVAA